MPSVQYRFKTYILIHTDTYKNVWMNKDFWDKYWYMKMIVLLAIIKIQTGGGKCTCFICYVFDPLCMQYFGLKQLNKLFMVAFILL